MNATVALPYPIEPVSRIGIAFGCALALYLTAILLTRTHTMTGAIIANGTFDDTVVGVEVDETPAAPPDVEPKQDVIISKDANDFPDETKTRVPIENRKFKPVVANSSRGRQIGDAPARFGSVRTFALSAPRPSYPYEARRQKIVGSGAALLTIELASGGVTNARMVQTTGSPILDNSAISALRQWRFKSGTVTSVQVPITFTLTGASY